VKYLASAFIKVGGFSCIAVATLTGCVTSSASGVPASSLPSASSADQNSVRAVGLLTLKGPELGAWWALTDTSGVVWRLELNSTAQQEQFRQWQNRRVEVDGTANGTFLSTRILRINRAALKAD
jgi:hypothetical protein